MYVIVAAPGAVHGQYGDGQQLPNTAPAGWPILCGPVGSAAREQLLLWPQKCSELQRVAENSTA